MTLQNGLIYKGRSYLWTDSLAVDEHGAESTVSKAIVGLGWPWAAIQSGMMSTEDPLIMSRTIGLQRPRNADELIDACRHALRAELNEGRPGRLLVAYACKKAGTRMFLMANDELICVPGVAPYEVHETMQFACSASDEHWTGEFAARDFTLLDMRAFIDEQIKRRIPTPLAYGGEFGGDLIEVRVTPKGVRPCKLRDIDRAPEREAA